MLDLHVRIDDPAAKKKLQRLANREVRSVTQMALALLIEALRKRK